jgi:hypothetical protein
MTEAEPARPALPKLQQDQRALIDQDTAQEVGGGFALRAGFPNRRELINWYQRAAVRTLGHIGDDWPAVDLGRDRTLLSATITSGARYTWSDDPLDPDDAREYRRRLETQVVLPACNRAYNDLRKTAGEYIDHDQFDLGDIDPLDQDHVAMRPGFENLDRQQSHALGRLWGGFETRDGLFDWVHWLDKPSNGAVADDLASRLDRDPVATKHLLSAGVDQESARRWREHFAIVELLPAFVEGVERLEAGELAKQTTTELTAPHG